MKEFHGEYKGEALATVNSTNTAAAVGSGSLPVFATPMMLALMEEATCEAASAILDDGETTVGIKVEITHDKASAMGATVSASAKLEAVDGRRLVFSVSAKDDNGNIIGKGTIERFVVNCGVTFSADCESKANIISRCLKELDASGNESIMVGDKKYDIEGAKANMIDSVGVLWGYGNRVEFAGAGAKFVAEKIDDIFSIALGYFEQTQEVQGIFSGRIIDVHNDKVMLVDGDIADREVVDHPGGVGIIGLTDENEILLVRQFRYPYKETIYEIPAGKLEKGEDPRQAGIREFSEECGAKAEVFESLGEIYPSPGYCGEIIRLFYAKGISYGEQHLDDDEFLDVIKMPIKEVITKIMTNEIKDAKTIAAVFKLKELMNL